MSDLMVSYLLCISGQPQRKCQSGWSEWWFIQGLGWPTHSVNSSSYLPVPHRLIWLHPQHHNFKWEFIHFPLRLFSVIHASECALLTTLLIVLILINAQCLIAYNNNCYCEVIGQYFPAIMLAVEDCPSPPPTILCYRKTGNFGVVKLWRILMHRILTKEMLTNYLQMLLNCIF